METYGSNRIRTAVQTPVESDYSDYSILGTYWLATPELTYRFPRKDDHDDARNTGLVINRNDLAQEPQASLSSINDINPDSYQLPAMLVASHCAAQVYEHATSVSAKAAVRIPIASSIADSTVLMDGPVRPCHNRPITWHNEHHRCTQHFDEWSHIDGPGHAVETWSYRRKLVISSNFGHVVEVGRRSG
jgi:hypothetical protein